jgi:hypothetical protein
VIIRRRIGTPGAVPRCLASLRESDLDEVDPTIPPEYAARLRPELARADLTLN